VGPPADSLNVQAAIRASLHDARTREYRLSDTAVARTSQQSFSEEARGRALASDASCSSICCTSVGPFATGVNNVWTKGNLVANSCCETYCTYHMVDYGGIYFMHYFDGQYHIRTSTECPTDLADTHYGRISTAQVEATCPTTASTDACFNVAMYDSLGDGWDGAAYRVTSSIDWLVVATGTFFDGYESIDEVCVEADVCHIFEVSRGYYPEGISWNVGDGVLTGEGATVEALELYATPSGELSRGCPTTASTVDTYGELLFLLERSATMSIQVAPTTFEFEAAISIGSGQDAAVTGTAGSSIFDGRDSNRLFIVVDGAKLTLRGLVLRNGRANVDDLEGHGGALLMRNVAHVELANCEVTDNFVLTTPQYFRAASPVNAFCPSKR
jgi:hypothetical protein